MSPTVKQAVYQQAGTPPKKPQKLFEQTVPPLTVFANCAIYSVAVGIRRRDPAPFPGQLGGA